MSKPLQPNITEIFQEKVLIGAKNERINPQRKTIRRWLAIA
jgi:hypothetical protein